MSWGIRHVDSAGEHGHGETSAAKSPGAPRRRCRRRRRRSRRRRVRPDRWRGPRPRARRTRSTLWCRRRAAAALGDLGQPYPARRPTAPWANGPAGASARPRWRTGRTPTAASRHRPRRSTGRPVAPTHPDPQRTVNLTPASVRLATASPTSRRLTRSAASTGRRVRTTRRQLGTGRLDDPRQVRPGREFLVGHRSPPPCRKLSAAATSSSSATVGRRGHQPSTRRATSIDPPDAQHATIEGGTQRLITAVWRSKSSARSVTAHLGVRPDPYGAHASAAASGPRPRGRAPSPSARPPVVGVHCARTVPGPSRRRRSTRSSSGPDSLPR